jgi:hypothetical protein
MQEQVAVATEAAASAGQSKTAATEQADIASSAAQTSTENKDAAQQAAQQSGTSAQASGTAADRAEAAKTSIIQSEQAAAASATAAAESAAHAEEVTLGKAASGDNNDITSLRALTADGFDRLRQGIAPMVGATITIAGAKGLVPVASVADRLKVLSGAGTWVALPTGAAWGAVTGTLSAQADLQNALDSKLAKNYPNLIVARACFTTVATPAISYSSNVVSVTRKATGIYTITLAAPIKQGWLVLGSVPGQSGATYLSLGGPNTSNAATSAIEVLTVTAGGGGLFDPYGISSFAIIGEWA